MKAFFGITGISAGIYLCCYAITEEFSEFQVMALLVILGVCMLGLSILLLAGGYDRDPDQEEPMPSRFDREREIRDRRDAMRRELNSEESARREEGMGSFPPAPRLGPTGDVWDDTPRNLW